MLQILSNSEWNPSPHISNNARVYLPRENVKPNQLSLIIDLIEGPELDALEDLFALIEPELLKKKLEEYSDLVEPLIQTHKKIEEYFGDNFEEVHLAYQADPEYEEEGMFVIEIKTKLSVDDAFDLLNRFDDEWFIENVFGETDPILTVTI